MQLGYARSIVQITVHIPTCFYPRCKKRGRQRAASSLTLVLDVSASLGNPRRNRLLMPLEQNPEEGMLDVSLSAGLAMDDSELQQLFGNPDALGLLLPDTELADEEQVRRGTLAAACELDLTCICVCYSKAAPSTAVHCAPSATLLTNGAPWRAESNVCVMHAVCATACAKLSRAHCHAQGHI